MKKLLIISLVSLALSLPAAGQQVWSLEDCINYALDNNIKVKQSAIAVEQREVELSTAQNSMLPGVKFGGSQNFSFGRGLTEDNTYAHTNTTNTSFSLGMDMPLFSGLKIKNTITRSKLNLESATNDLEKIKDDIRTSVAAAYVQILYNKEILDVAERQVQIDSQQVVRLTGMAENGKASKAEVAAQKASLSKSHVTAVEAENNLHLSVLTLTQLLELPSPEGFEVVVPDESAFAEGLLPAPDDVYDVALGIRPGIRSEKIRLDAAETSIAIAKSAYYPSLSMNGGLGTNYYTTSISPSKAFFDQLSSNFSQYVGLSLNIPIFNRFSTRNSVRAAKLSYNDQSLKVESVKKDLYKEIQQAYYNALAAESKYHSSIEAERSASEAFELMSAKYENGKATLTEFDKQKSQYLEAASNLAQARYRFLYQSKLLDFYKGGELKF